MSKLPWVGQPVHHVALKVRDLTAAEAFYVGTLGLPVTQRHTDDQGAPRSTWVALNDTLLMLERTELPTARGGWHLIALRIHASQRAAAKAALAARGVALTGETDFSIYIEDPEGNRIALSHWPDRA